MEVAILFITLIVFLFTLFALSREDFVLLRKNITMDQIFNSALLALFFGLFTARFIYVIASFKWTFFNPLIFLALPYFPGISIIGGIVGAVIFILYYTSYKKIHKERLFDFFNLSLLAALTTGYPLGLFLLFVQRKPIELYMYIPLFFLFIVCFIFFMVLVPKQRRGEMREGYIGLLFLVCFSALWFIFDILSKSQKIVPFVGVEGIIAFVLFGISLFFLLKKEKKTIRFAKIRI